MPNPENLNEPWKAGDPSPNPSGRPKGTKNLTTILREMLELEIEVDGQKITQKDAMIKKLIKQSTSGNLRAIQEVFDRIEGKAKQEIRYEGLPKAFITVDPLADDPANNSDQENSPS